ncbi:MMPL family transporter [Azospirillum doebereinerae]
MRRNAARLAALVWLLVVAVAGVYLAGRVHAGLSFRTDLLALLPREEVDPVLQQANETVTRSLARRVVALVGHANRDEARAAARRLTDDLSATGLIETAGGGFDGDRMKRIGTLYFPHRQGLLSPADRASLTAGQGEEVAIRALSQVFGFVGLADAGLLRNDPFLLLPSFFTSLPFPLSRLTLDDGLLTVVEGGTTWILVNATLRRDPFELAVQDAVVGAFDRSVAALRARTPGIEVKRLGAVFFAQAGASTGMREATILTTLTVVGAVLMIVAVFRRVAPLLHNVLALGVGLGVGMAGSLALFGELHVATLLFGSSLIGVAVDYGLYYSGSLFDPALRTPRERLRSIMPGITLGLVTALSGYASLMLAPMPGLRQIAAFSILGLLATYATVVLWLPLLDRAQSARHGRGMLRAAGRLGDFWDGERHRRTRVALAALAVVAGVAGLFLLRSDDDVRRMQSLSPDLVRQQEEVQRLIGAGTASQFLLVQAPDTETALRREEAVVATLERLKAEGALAGYQMPAAFVPSAERQRENRALVRNVLEDPLLERQRAQLGLPTPAEPAAMSDAPLTLDAALSGETVPFLRELVLAPGLHVVALQGLARPDAVRAALTGAEGVRLVDPTADFSALLGKYRQRALLLTGLAALLMVPALAWRYGWRGAAGIMVPPVAAVLLTPGLLGLVGQDFSFFHAMALVLVLSIGMDYAVFCAEGGAARRPVTILSVFLASLMTQLSFGLLSVSSAFAVHGFGLTMLVGILLAFLMAPLAGRCAPRRAMRSDANASVLM